MKLGFVGLGEMGRPMVGHLLEAGFDVHLWARRPQAAHDIAQDRPVTVHDSPAGLAAAVDVVISIITDSHAVAELALGKGGLIEGFRKGALHIDMSTIAPTTARQLARTYDEAGVGWVDAPVSGGAVGAQQRRLVFMAGGPKDQVERAIPLFEALGHAWVHIGEAAGSGQIAKACNQMVLVNTLAACAEAMQLARAHDLDLALVQKALMGGSAASRMLEVMGTRMIDGQYQNGVQSRLHHKDYRIILNEASDKGIALPLTDTVAPWLSVLMAHEMGHLDTSALFAVLERHHHPKTGDFPHA
jgi:2-hydroxy-3-oxopropionate reductase